MKKTWLRSTIALLLGLAVFATWSFTPVDAAEKKTVTIGLEDWSSEIASSNLVKAVLWNKLKVKCRLRQMGVSEQYESVSNGSIDAMVGAWLPGQTKYLENHKDQLEDLGPNLEGAKIGLVVPVVSSTWLMSQDGNTEGYMKIDSIEEIKDHYDDFNGKIIGIETDSGMMTIMRDKLISAYGLDEFELIPGTEVSMTAELANAIKKRKWIVVLGWTPHWKFGRWALKFLDDPKKVWGGGESIHTLARKGLKDEMPKVYKFLDNFKWSPDNMEQLLLWNQMGGNPYENANRWIKANPEIVESWFK